jgi:hypothetical protein
MKEAMRKAVEKAGNFRVLMDGLMINAIKYEKIYVCMVRSG